MKTVKERRLAADGAPARIDVDSIWRWIAQNAYELYEQRGRREGSALDDWLAAEDIVRDESHEASARLVTRWDDVTAPYRAGRMAASAPAITSELTLSLEKRSER